MTRRDKNNSPYRGVQPIHEEEARYDSWIVAVLAGALVLTVVMALGVIRIAPFAIWLMLGLAAFEGVVFHAVCPRRYQIFSDRLKIVLGRPFAFEIPLDTIEAARPGPGRLALAYFGWRFSPSTKTVVEIVRRGHWNVVISPRDRERFLEALKRAIEVARTGQRKT